MELYDRSNAPKRHDTWFVYGLVDSRIQQQIRYIGITNFPRKRLSRHYSDAKTGKTHKSCWIRSVMYGGGDIMMRILCKDLTHEAAKTTEIDEISRHENLTNTTGGGDGSIGVPQTEEQRAAHSQRMSGVGNPNFGKPRDAETRAKISAKLSCDNPRVGTKHNPETIQKMRKPKRDGFSDAIAARRRAMPPKVGKYKGVFNVGKKWIAAISIGGNARHLGTFTTPESAAYAYDAAAAEAWGSDKCYLNFDKAA